MRRTKRDGSRYLVLLLMFAALSHAAAGIGANHYELALSQAACDHCQIILADEGIDYSPVVGLSGFELIEAPSGQAITFPRHAAKPSAIANLERSPYPSKVRLHLLHCVMRD